MPLNLTSISPGTSLGRYKLLESIGAGGMGEVWRARDANLDRDVAIKFLRTGQSVGTETRERFRREALVLSRLSHPGVATIFDFDTQDGTDFLVMEYVPGGSLETRLETGPLSLKDLTRFGAIIADALHSAHERGILHRDLKPGNIVLTESGQPKILDFGIALLMDSDPNAVKLTQAGMILGSLPYMAPEQLSDDPSDARTDIYALGVLLFEMATGRRPFIKERREALMFEIFSNSPPTVRSLRPEVPAAVDQLVDACLRKEPAERPSSAAMVAETLRAVAGGTSSGAMAARETVRGIVVLPLRNVSGDPSQEYFADGMTDAIISDLSRIKALRVISRTSAMRYKGSTLSLPEIARELNVDAVLEGSALLVGNRVRVSVQLVSARTDQTIWAARWDRDLVDVLSLQGDLAATMAHEIAVQLTPAEEGHLAHRATVNPEAHLEMLKSRHNLIAGTREALELGLLHARRALELDPTYAFAWSALADCQSFRAARGMANPAEVGGEATAAARRAIELDPSLGDAWTSLGLIAAHSGDVVGGMRALQKAIVLNPGLTLAHNVLSRTLYAFERHEEALASATRAVQLDPLSTFIHTGLGDASYFAREYDKSVFHYRMSIELDARFDGAHTDMARSLEALGRFDEAHAAYEEGRRLGGGIAGPSFGLAHLAAARGNEAEARRILAELTAARGTRVVSAWGIGALHASLGDVDEAFKWLEIAITEKASGLILLRVHPRLDPIRKDPRYWPMVERMGLTDAALTT